jgi:pimeloyl-ACP methyl ester carboxylesterase
MPFYQRGDVRIRYEETGSGFPLLVTPGGGLNSRVSNWPTAVINAMEAFKNDFRCITMDQRNANGGESTGPVQVDNPWDAFADDQLGLMDHLGIHEFFYMGYCIGGCFAGKLMQRAPNRVVAAVFCQSYKKGVVSVSSPPRVTFRGGLRAIPIASGAVIRPEPAGHPRNARAPRRSPCRQFVFYGTLTCSTLRWGKPYLSCAILYMLR